MPFFQFFSSSNIKLSVAFDSPHCYPGGEMSGKVTVHVTKEVAIRALVIHYQIVEHHDHVLGPDVVEIKSGKYAEEKSQEKLPIVHEREITLYGDARVGETTVKPGSYEYDFRIPIPHTAPPTMNEPFPIGVRDSCCCVPCDSRECNCQCCGWQIAQALTLQHRVVAEVVMPRSTDKTSKIENVPRVLGVYPAHRFPPALVVTQREKSYQFNECRMCPCHAWETKEQADFTMMSPRPYVLLARGTRGEMDVFVRGKVNCPFDVLLIRFARELEDGAVQSQQVYESRLNGADDRHMAEFRRIRFMRKAVPNYRETSQVIASVSSGPIDDQAEPGKRLRLQYDHAMFGNMCTYIGRSVSVVYGLVLRMDYQSACCGGVDAMRESRLPVTVVHDCGYMPENDFRFILQDPPNCDPRSSSSNRPVGTAPMGHPVAAPPMMVPPQGLYTNGPNFQQQQGPPPPPIQYHPGSPIYNNHHHQQQHASAYVGGYYPPPSAGYLHVPQHEAVVFSTSSRNWSCTIPNGGADCGVGSQLCVPLYEECPDNSMDTQGRGNMFPTYQPPPLGHEPYHQDDTEEMLTK